MWTQMQKFFISLTLTLVTVIGLTQAGKILIKPFGQCWGSHLLNMETLAGFLAGKGHEVYFLAPSRYAGPYNQYAKHFQNRVFPVKYSTPEYEMEHTFQACEESHSIDKIKEENTLQLMSYRMSHELSHCQVMFKSTGFLKRVKSLNADMLITDGLSLCGSILATYLNIPYVTMDMIPGAHRSAWGLPFTPYIPDTDMPFSDDMTLIQRVQNTLSQTVVQPVKRYILMNHVLSPYKELMDFCDITDVSLTDLVHHRAVYRIYNSDFSIEYPSPTLPDMVFIGGFFNKESKPLEKEMKLFLKDVKESEGLVIVNMGSRALYDMRWGNLFAKALAQLPCKVVWRYVPSDRDFDDFPSEHGKNTMIVKWLPQRELLAQPVTKLFVTHAGAGAMFEAVYHGVPVVTIPLSTDQPHQARKLTDHLKMGTYLDVATLTADNLHTAITTTLHNKEYAENAKKAAKIFKLNSKSQEDKILSVVNNVLATKGEINLKSRLSTLPWYQYYSVDVIFVILLCIMFLPMPFYLFSRIFSNTSNKKCKEDSKND